MGLPERVAVHEERLTQLERRQDYDDQFRHEIRDKLDVIRSEQAAQSARLAVLIEKIKPPVSRGKLAAIGAVLVAGITAAATIVSAWIGRLS